VERFHFVRLTDAFALGLRSAVTDLRAASPKRAVRSLASRKRAAFK
jgi:hypothetical protein